MESHNPLDKRLEPFRDRAGGVITALRAIVADRGFINADDQKVVADVFNISAAEVRGIIIDPRQIDLVRSPHIEAQHHLALLPGTNVPMMNAFAYVLVTEQLLDDEFVAQRCDTPSFQEWLAFVQSEENSPEVVSEITGVYADTIRAAARLFAGASHN